MIEKKVTIWLADDGVGGIVVKVSLDPVHVSASKGECVVWECPEGEAKIVFEGGGPFRSPHFEAPSGGFVGSGVPLRGKPGEHHKYKVIVTRTGDNRKYPLDPEVVVDNGG